MAETLAIEDDNADGLMKMVRASLETIKNMLDDGPDTDETRYQIEQLEQLEQLLVDQALRLDAINRVLEEFNYSVAHELFAPLRRISGFTQEIKRRFADELDSAGVSSLDSILEAAQQMNELIDALIQLSRLSHLELQPVSVNLTPVATSIMEELSLKEPHRRVATVISPELRVTGDATLLAIALRKLLENAWKYTAVSEPGQIEVGLVKKDGIPTVYIKDNGAGFDMSDYGRLFHPFQRLHDADLYPGNGIGLTAAKRVIDRHGGRIWAEAAIGTGATFYFSV